MKCAVVTGAAKGLGKAMATMLALQGYGVVINYRNSQKEAHRTLKMLKKINGGCIVAKGDVTREVDVKRVFSSVKKKFGRVDVLINNVGDFLHKPLLKTTKKELMEVVENNVVSAFLCSKAAIPIMAKQKRGRIVNIGSVGCTELLAPDDTAPYYVGKTGVWLLTKALARNVPKGVTVNMISPGILRTSIVSPKGAAFTEMQEVVSAAMKLIKSDGNGKNLTVAKWKPQG